VRPATLARLGIGSVCLGAPAGLLALIGGPDRDDPRTRDVVRVLGARMVGQAALDLAVGPRTRRVDLAVELLHAASMVPLALWSHTHRRSATVSALTASGIAVLDLRDTPGVR
jgi:hypothetical protein